MAMQQCTLRLPALLQQTHTNLHSIYYFLNSYNDGIHQCYHSSNNYAKRQRLLPPSATTNSSIQPPSQTTQAQVIIAGAGVVGNSIAYHLVQNGWRDVMVLEQNTIGSGSSNFGSGTLNTFKPIAMRNIIMSSIKLYKELDEMGFHIGLRQCGSINLAQTRNRMIAFKRRMAYNIPTGLHCELLLPNEISKMHPYLNTEYLEGGVWVSEDAVADPLAICLALAKLAKEGGAVYQEHCNIKRVKTSGQNVSGVVTDRGHISCEYFINCAGMWSRELGLQCDKPVSISIFFTLKSVCTFHGRDGLDNIIIIIIIAFIHLL